MFSDPPMNTLAVTVEDGRGARPQRARAAADRPSRPACRTGAHTLGVRANHLSIRAAAPSDIAIDATRRAGRDLGLGDLRPRPQRRPALGRAGGGRARACAGPAGAGPSSTPRASTPSIAAGALERRRCAPRAGAEGRPWPGSTSRPSPTPTRPTRSGPQDYALKPLQFAFEDGGAYALLGPSGCGKTTLLNIISGLLRPSEGRVLFDRRDVTRAAAGRSATSPRCSSSR